MVLVAMHTVCQPKVFAAAAAALTVLVVLCVECCLMTLLSPRSASLATRP
jgi:hypothetical protein